jgi:hypothetical protein
MPTIRLYRVIIPVADLGSARHFYATLLDQTGVRVFPASEITAGARRCVRALAPVGALRW